MNDRTERTKNTLPVILASTAALAYYFFLRPQLLKWNTRLGESQRRLPGDDVIPQPNLQLTHAINIDAPPEAVWPWLAQMGRDGSGFYALDALRNRGVPSVRFVRRDLPGPEAGMPMDGGFHIIEAEANRQLLFGAFSVRRLPFATVDVSALYLLERRRDGSTRLIARRREYAFGALRWLYTLVQEPLLFLELYQQLRRLKELGESMAHLSVAAPSPAR